MERKQNSGYRQYIVEQFVLTIEDDEERLVCHLMMANYTEVEICRRLGIRKSRLSLIKLRLAIELRKAGIRN